jgi:REP element-mobilizing transposase RayT
MRGLWLLFTLMLLLFVGLAIGCVAIFHAHGWRPLLAASAGEGTERGQSRRTACFGIDGGRPGRHGAGMARKLRVQYPGAIYHVMNRGDRREPIFRDDADRRRFLETLAETCAKTGWQVHAACLMGNHFHLVVETPAANLVAGMKWFLGTYTARFNRRHRVFGHLFSGRYKAIVVDGSGNGYLRTVCDYVHLNPVRAKLLTPEEPLRAYAWSTYGQYLLPPGKRSPGCGWTGCWGRWASRRTARRGGGSLR